MNKWLLLISTKYKTTIISNVFKKVGSMIILTMYYIARVNKSG